MSTADVVCKFYDAFARRDAETMVSCYADDVRFSDPVFPDLSGNDARALWKMLCLSAKDFSLTYTLQESNAQSAVVDWVACYTFAATGRRVENRIRARMQFRDGKIVDHKDDFDFHRWAKQALGPVGFFLGYFPFFKAKVRANAGRNLQKFISSSR